MATGNIDQQDTMEAFDDYTYSEEDDESGMTLVEHLEELRWRILKSLIAIAIGGIIAFIFRVQIMQFLTLPLPKTADSLTHGKLVVTGIAEGFTVFLKLSFAAGFVVALPVILYQVWAFIEPGLLPREKKHAVPFIIVGIILFIAGLALGYIVLQYPVQWLVNFASGSFAEFVTADSYFTFVAFFLLAFGIVFEIPLILTFLSVIGLVSSDTLKRRRAYSHVGMWIAATFLTPPLPKTADSLTHGKLVVTGIAEGFTVFLKLSFAAGFVVALPVILYQVWAFIEPGLLPREKKHAVPFIIVGIILFIAGLALGYIVLQYPVQWLVNFASGSFAEFVTADSYFTFVAFFLLAFGVVFEIPLILTFLSIIGLVSSDSLKRRRAYSHVGMWIAATFLTPGADIYSPIILGVAMSCLYELTILFIWFTKRSQGQLTE